MNARVLSGIAAGFLMAAGMTGAAQASMTSLLDHSTEWAYTDSVAWSALPWNTSSYSSFDWNNAAWDENPGHSAFGNTLDFVNFPTNTYWRSGSHLALQQTININGILNGPLTLNIGADNDFRVFVNGNNEVARLNTNNQTSKWKYLYMLPTDFFVTGSNLIQVLAEDRDFTTYFDIQLAADIVEGGNGDPTDPVDPVDPVDAVPEPATLFLLGTGVLGMIALRRKSS